MSQSAIWLSEADVASLVSLKDTLGVLEAGVRELGEDTAFNIPKALANFHDASSLHSLGSVMLGAGVCGFKNWINTPQGAKALFILFDANEGRLLAMMEANCLGQMRTAAMTGLGTRWMTNPDVREMTLIGTGRQALAQVAAVHLVQNLKQIRIWSPTAEKRQAFCKEVASQFDIEVIESKTLEEATEGAPIVTTVTRAREPFLKSSMLAHGAHLNAVGAILPHSAEFEQEVFERVGFIGVDDVPNAKKASRELIEYFDKGAGAGNWDRVRPLGKIIANGEKAPAGCDITLFKSMGMGISDLTVAALAYRRANERGIGEPIPLVAKAPVRWTDK
ncbi:ornithine cyclodeaminase family protein [Noviherbaspirillum aerium]|uniref:ornithine cyclodeaminase family protein n=1 Tax=Noviherbaspirillum aerium TaxID=2588497 RepID=UPI00124DBC59|nr:ornithine cyclodeaminase family protein [Noviherbaspirillum aerium]